MIKRILLLAVLSVACSALPARAQSLGQSALGEFTGEAIGDIYNFTWSHSGATWYQLWVDDESGTPINAWYTSEEANCTTAGCRLVLDVKLTPGNMHWWIRGWNSSQGYAAWSPMGIARIAGRMFRFDLNGTNIAFGLQALQHAAKFDAFVATKNNIAIGDSALTFATAYAVGNTAVGTEAVRNLQGDSGSLATFNTGIGYQALSGLNYGTHNLGIGILGGANLTSGNLNVYVGSRGPGSFGSESNTIRIGDGTWHTRAFVSGVYGVTSAGGTNVFVNSSGQLGTITSSARYKTEVRDVGIAREQLFNLRPVAFRYTAAVDPDQAPQFGLIAEEVATVFPELVLRNAEGQPETVRYHLLVPLLLDALKAQQDTLRSLSDRLARMEVAAAADEERRR